MTTTIEDAGEKETIPPWVSRVVNEMNGEDVKFLFAKQLTASDLRRQQSRLLVPRSVLDKLKSALVNEDELSAVGFDNDINGEDAIAAAAAAAAPATRVKRSTFASGLKVKAYIRNIWKFNLNMIFWASSDGFVINGSDWCNLVGLRGFTKGTQVRVWSFRTQEEEDGSKKVLNLVIGDG